MFLQYGDGWQGGYFEVLLCTGRPWAPCGSTQLLIGGPTDGVVVGDGKHLSFRLPTDGKIQVHLSTVNTHAILLHYSRVAYCSAMSLF